MTKPIHIPPEMLFDGKIPPGAADVVLSNLKAADTLSDWQRARLGKITASKFGLVKRLRTGDWGETAFSYLYDLVGEHLTGQPSQTFTGSDATEWGNEYEAEAIEAYTKRTGRKVKSSNVFLQHPELQFVGGTPDGLIGEKGIVEVKCPFTFKNHLRTVITRTVPDEYLAQIHGYLWLSGRDWCDFVSFDPRIPKKHREARLVIVRVNRGTKKGLVGKIEKSEWNIRSAEIDPIENLAVTIGEFHDLLLEKLAKLKIKI